MRPRLSLARICLPTAAIIFVCQAVCFSPSAAAEEKKSLIILVSMEKCCPDKYWADAEKAVVDEFSTLNTKMKVVHGVIDVREEWNRELATIAQSKHANCALRIFGSSEGLSGGVDIWVTDRETGEITSRHIPLGATKDSEAASIATLRSLEAIRAVLIAHKIRPLDDMPQTQPEPEEKSEPAPEATAETQTTIKKEVEPESSSNFGVGLGMGIAGGPGNVGALGEVDLTLAWKPGRMLLLEVDGAISVFGSDIQKDDEVSSFDVALIRAWGYFDIPTKVIVKPALGIGGGIAFSWTDGTDSQLLDGTKDRTQVAYLGGAARVGLVLSDYFWLVFGVKAGALLPEVKVLFGEEVVASLGRPLIDGFINLEARFM